MQTTLYKTKIGTIKLTSSDNFLTALDVNPLEDGENFKSEFNDSVIIQIEEYLDGKRKSFDVALLLPEKSPFNLKVWNELLKIPYGETVSYKELAFNIGHDSAYRAVGSAAGKNPIPIIIPCHRLISSNGGLGGFSLGLDIKKKLLKIEQMDGLKKNC